MARLTPWVVVAAVLTTVGSETQDPAVPPIPAARYITNAFTHYPLVAFSEPGHGAPGTREFLASLIREPGFAGTVNDIVVEFGNARYQDVVDRYIASGPVAREQLKAAWENTTIVTGVWSAPMYEGVLQDIRATNATLPAGQRFRVLLGDPPIDWSVVRGPADEDMNDWRDAHAAWVIEQQVIRKRRKALIWYGGAHLSRRVVFPESLIHLLDARFPSQTLVAIAVDRALMAPDAAVRVRDWPHLGVAPVRNTWLGRMDAGAIGFRLSADTVEENVDAMILWDSQPPSPDDTGPVSLSPEFQRRRALAEATLPFRGGRIRFDANAVALATGSEAALESVLAELRRDTGLRLMVKAFADAREPNAVELSRNRASAVVQWLVARGIDLARLVPRGCGSSRALWYGRTEEERAANRRAELARYTAQTACGPPASFDGFR